MLLLTFMTDFAKIALATDHVRSSRKPETWNIGGFVVVSVATGVAMVAETLLLLWIGWSRFGLATNNGALYTFSLLTLTFVGPHTALGYLGLIPLTTGLVGSCPLYSILGRWRTPRRPASPSGGRSSRFPSQSHTPHGLW
jgi:hypothetical protein